MAEWKRVAVIASVVVVVILLALVAPLVNRNNTTTTATTVTTVTTATSSAQTGQSSSPGASTSILNTTAPADLTQLKVLSVRLVNTSVGSDLEFNVTFTNSGSSPIYYLASPVRLTDLPCSGADLSEYIGGNTTTTVVNSTSITPGCPNPPPLSVNQSPSGQSAGCGGTTSLLPLAPNATVNASDSPCNDGATFTITGSGTFEATLSVTWAPTDSNSYLANPYTTSITQLFKVG
jgi:hypothetical protein